MIGGTMTQEGLPKDGDPVLHRASHFLGAISQREKIHHQNAEGLTARGMFGC